jgi:predicted GIY-YIG superfamily endonuclease
MTYVYFIQKGYGSVKIGVADNPEQRLRSLQTGNHGELHLIAKLPCSSRSAAFEMERDSTSGSRLIG